ncbi:keratin 97 [Polymixia lowei]
MSSGFFKSGSAMSISGGYSSGGYSSSGYSKVGMVRAPSVHGGAGGRNVRVSYPSRGCDFDLSSALGGGGGSNGVGVSVNEKATMQNLNDRLATYLEKVRRLESANTQLERQIREWYENRTLTVSDYSKYEVVVADLCKKINGATLDNARIILQLDNAKLATEDFKVKFENEMAMRMSVEADIAGLRKVLDELTMSRSDLEMQIEGLKEELVYLKKNHAEELAALRCQVTSGSVNVEVDAAPQQDLSCLMQEIRSQYEGINEKNRREMETWYKAKFDDLNKQVEVSTVTLQTTHSEVNELRRTLQALEIELQSQVSLKGALEGQLGETESRYSLQLSQLQAMVNRLEMELSQVKMDIERQASEYKMLLDIKTRLEMEIAEYRRLLDGEDVKQTVVVETVVEQIPVKHEPVVTKRVRTVIEEVVDGKVVSRTEDVDVEVISK